MKEIIWVFGESGTGKLTLINRLYNKDENTLATFNMKDKKICTSDITLEDRNTDYNNVEDKNTYNDSYIEPDNKFFHKERMLVRRKGIMYDTENFINSDNDVLLIKGQTNDMNAKRGNIIGNFLKKYGFRDDVKVKVYVLQVSDSVKHIERLKNKSWFQKIDNQDIRNTLVKVITQRQGAHYEEVEKAFKNADVTIYKVESGDDSYTLRDVLKPIIR